MRRTRAPGAGNADGYCQCGCGEKTNLAAQTDTKRGYVKGEPMRYRQGHQPKRRTDPYKRIKPENHGYYTPCWIWQGGSTTEGYGRLKAKGRMIPAHHWFYEDAGHTIPIGLQIDHLCRVPACVNPNHLEPVSVAENVQRGLSAKLTPAQVVEIRAARDKTPAELAVKYGVTPRQIKHVWSGHSWANLEMSA